MANWSQTLAEKKKHLASRWQDQRPLIILAGDSQIEYGEWYNLFAGARAVRNCGLSRAKIADVTQLVLAMGDSHPQTVVTMCGINNLGADENPNNCLRTYGELLEAIHTHLQPKSVLVLSVMPVRETVVDRASHKLNMVVRQFNIGLKACCRQHQSFFWT